MFINKERLVARHLSTRNNVIPQQGFCPPKTHIKWEKKS